MKHQHPALLRAAALQNRYWAHAPQPAAPVADSEMESTPATQLEVETLRAEQDYLEYDEFLKENPFEYCADSAERAADLYANWQTLNAQLEGRN